MDRRSIFLWSLLGWFRIRDQRRNVACFRMSARSLLDGISALRRWTRNKE